MTNPANRISYMLYRLKRRFGCQHDPSEVTADILDGDLYGGSVQWCRRCGAYRRGFGSVYEVEAGAELRVTDWRIPSGWEAR